MYLPVGPAAAAWTLAAYTAGFVTLTLFLLHRRDIAARPDQHHRRRSRRRPPGHCAAVLAAGAVPVLAGADAVLASLRAELLVIRHRPAV